MTGGHQRYTELIRLRLPAEELRFYRLCSSTPAEPTIAQRAIRVDVGCSGGRP
jgi:hypothetical protein